MEVLSHNFKTESRQALLDDDLRAAMDKAEGGFVDTRSRVVERLSNFESFREYGRDIKNHVLANLEHYLCQFEENVQRSGGHVHWARNGEEANDIIRTICKNAEARKVLKGKSMVSEEAGVNESLESEGLEVIETDLGEYIIQLARERPSHLIAPAIHKSRQSVTDLFAAHHAEMGLPEVSAHEDIVDQARKVLREHFCTAEVGITGANFLVASTGSAVVVTNEGNGDLSATLPKVHIVTASIEKVIPDTEALGGFLRLLGRSATGQEFTVYTTMFTGPRRNTDLDGPEEFHVVLLDNGRSEVLGGKFQDILRCIRCGACLNHCPVYTSIGGHAYGWVYPGPMGSVLTPILVGRERARDLPNACTLNGRCASVCPVKIPLSDLLRNHRKVLADSGDLPRSQKMAMKVWYYLAKRPRLYKLVTAAGIRIMGGYARLSGASKRGSFESLPFAAGWTETRDFPVPATKTFQAGWRNR